MEASDRARSECVFFNGILHTQDPACPRAEALAVADGKIVAVGTSDDIENLVGPRTRRIDLEGRCLIPGFNDAHVHLWKVGHLLTTMIDLRTVESIEGLQQTIRHWSARLPEGAWLQGRGYNETRMKEGRQPTRWDLDEASPDRPVCLTRVCGHMMVANTKVMELSGITSSTGAPPGGTVVRNERGECTGVLQETAMGLLLPHMPRPSAAEYAEMIEAACRHQHALGITSATEAGVLPDLLRVYRALDTQRKLVSRVNVMAMRKADGETTPLPLPERYISDCLRVDSVKLIADGGLSGATAALRSPYRVGPSRGLLRLEEEELFALAKEAKLAGLHVATHAIGDRAIDTVLSVYEKLDTLPEHRLRLEHFGLPDAADIHRAARLRAIAVSQTVFIESLGPNFRLCLSQEYLTRAYPVRDMLEAGLVVALSSDAPVVEADNPLLGMKAAILRRDCEGEPIATAQAISAAQALYGYTMGGSLASGDDANRGSLTAGKWADLAVLSADPLEVAPEALTEIRVHETYVGGKRVYEG